VLGWPIYGPAANAMVADLVEEGKRTQAYGLLRVVHNLGVVIGPSAGGLIIAFGSYFWLFSTAAVASAVFFLITLLFIKETRPEAARRPGGGEVQAGGGGGYARVLRDRVFLGFCLISVVVTIVYAQLTTTFPVFLKDERQIAENLWGLLMALNAGMVVLFQFPLTRWSDRYVRTGMMALGSLLYAVGFGSITLASSFALFALCVVVLTVGEMVYIPTVTAFVADIAPEDLRGRYMGAAGLIWGAGYGLGPVTGGLVMDRLGGVYIWPLTLALGLVGAAAYLLLGRFIGRTRP
jgi:MFS family permease